jgi:hypothetical protein
LPLFNIQNAPTKTVFPGTRISANKYNFSSQKFAEEKEHDPTQISIRLSTLPAAWTLATKSR